MRIRLVHRSDGDRFIEISGVADGKIHVGVDVAVSALENGETFIPCSDDDDHALIPEPAQFHA